MKSQYILRLLYKTRSGGFFHAIIADLLPPSITMQNLNSVALMLALSGSSALILPVHAQTQEESQGGPRVCFNPHTESIECPANSKMGSDKRSFDFTALDASGAETKVLGKHHCVRDNATKLIWSTQTLDLKRWNEAMTAGTGYSRCGYASGWRLPTYLELVSIVQYGKVWPSIDEGYFPNTAIGWYWVSEEARPVDKFAAIVNFKDGGTNMQMKYEAGNVRLVRDSR